MVEFWDKDNPEWYEAKPSKLVVNNILDGYEIIGIRCSDASYTNQIPRLAFITWRPRHYWKAFEDAKDAEEGEDLVEQAE